MVLAPLRFFKNPTIHNAGYTPGVSTISGFIRFCRGIGRCFSSELDKKVHDVALSKFNDIEYKKEEEDTHIINGLKDMGRGLLEMIPLIGNVSVWAFDKVREHVDSPPPAPVNQNKTLMQTEEIDEPRSVEDEGVKTLTLSKEEVENLGGYLWKKIESKEYEKLIITKDGETFAYTKRVLQQLLEKKPPIDSLTDQYTLKFSDGEIKLPKAELLLCGEYFKNYIEEFGEEQKAIDFSSLTGNTIRKDLTLRTLFRRRVRIPSRASIKTFKGLLQEVRTGKKDALGDDYKTVCDYFHYSKWPPIPEGAFGPDQWAEMGVKINDVPPVPKIIRDREDLDSYLVVLIPSNISFNKLVAKSGVGYDFKWVALDEYGNKPEDKSYWVAIKKELMPNSHGTATRQEQLQMAAADGIHQAPSLMEAVACNIASYKSTGQSLWGVRPDGYSWFSVCRDETVKGKVLEDRIRLIVGGSAAGLFVDDRSFFDHDSVGVARLLREF